MKLKKTIDLEQAVRKRLASSGGELLSTGLSHAAGFPEYVAILPGGHVGFVELGMPGQSRIGPLSDTINHLRTLGCAACVVTDLSQINRLVMYLLSDAGKDASWNAYQDYRLGMVQGVGDVT